MSDVPQWWEAGADKAGAMFSAVSDLRQQQGERAAKNERCLRMYGQTYTIGDSAVRDVYSPSRDLLSLNVVRSVCDTVHADITQNRPHPTFATLGDDMAQRWALQRKARKLEQFVEGVFDGCEVYDVSSAMERDATIFDLAACQFGDDGDSPTIERVLPFELVYDDRECLSQKPRAIIRATTRDKWELAERFPRRKAEIFDAAGNAGATPYADMSPNMVAVCEGWRLPVSDSKPGRHRIAIHGQVLLDEPWAEREFPLLFHRWSKLPLGFVGESIANQLTGIQYEIKKLLREIQDAHHMLGKAKVLWPKTSGAPRTHWDNAVGTVIEYDNPREGKPTVEAFAVVSPEIYQHLERLYAWAYEIVGVSQLGAQAKKPAGLDSGRALMVYEDANSRRFIDAGRAYEKLHVEIAKQIVRVGRRLYEKNGDFKARYSGSRYGRAFVQTIDWEDVSMDDDQYVMRVFPTSSLPKSPAGRMAFVEQLVGMGALAPHDALRLLDFPDVDEFLSMQLASWRLITETLDRMLDADKPDEAYEPPEPFMDLELALKLAQGAYLCAKKDGAPEANLELLRRYMMQAKNLIEKAKPPAPAAPPPGAVPEMPPGMPPDLPPPPPVGGIA